MISRLKSIFAKALPSSAPAAGNDEVIRQLPLFHTLTRRERGLLRLILHERTYTAGEVICEEGEEGLSMYVIIEGKATAFRTGDRERRELTLGVGDSFGEMALLQGARRPATLVASESPTRLLSLFQPELLQLLEGHHRIGYKISYQLACMISKRFRTFLARETGNELIH
ncbi:protein phosphatase [Verrucomicrobium sp. GAS474]|uniref:cyclic nucleotide-binding domain-containing protein n=1 Tax=Verrucomicrobium sp. GAS474 TaxID=1882831 RepID=UPI00087A8A50|nr:cyclic nucleotide-binding domain-containing protein [Verrucomicrobium sp. GAS474]SDU28389.1 protein phosphatase [Verrucomicrobium sp. GAS474]